MKKPLSTNLHHPQATSVARAETEEIKRMNDPIPALAALYQGEKTDASYVFNTAMAMMGIAVLYLLSAIPFVGSLGHGQFGWLFLLLLPIPLWLIVAFHSLMTLNAMSHGISVRIIEEALFEASQLRVKRDLVGSEAGDKIMDITKSKAAHKLITYFVYGGVGLMVIGFTIFALYSANAIIITDFSWFHMLVFWIATGIYLLILIMVAISWKVGLRIIGEADALAKSYPPWHLRRDPPGQ